MSLNTQALKDMANRLRMDSIAATNAAKSGHPTSCSSMAEVMSVLFFHTMKYSLKEPKHPGNDRFILSKGHAAPILYAAWAEAGLFPVSDLMNLRKIDSDLEGHPTPRLNFIDVATGSLGQGLSVAAGMAYMAKYFDKTTARNYVLIGDGESCEGSNWEAVSFASYYKLNNLCIIVDCNRLGQSEPTSLQHDLECYANRFKAFGCQVYVVDGHSVEDLINAFNNATNIADRPQCIIAKTYKGRGFPEIEDKDNWHGKPLGVKADIVLSDIKSKITSEKLDFHMNGPVAAVPNVSLNVHLSEPPNYSIGDKIATRQAYGTSLVKLGKVNERVIACDGDTKNSTFSETYKKAFLDRYVECFIAEQNLVGVAIGLGCRGRAIPFASTFACFFTRAFDQLRMGAISRVNLKCVGSHCGVSIGEDGPSQMGLEDLAMFKSLPEANVFYPSDAVSMERATELAAQHIGIDYIRTSRPALPVIYPNDTVFKIGESKVVRTQGAQDKCLIIGAGVTLFEALNAAEKLQSENISCRVLDPFTIKPLDSVGICKNAKECGSKIIVVEDHYLEGGIGETVASALSEEPEIIVKKIAVREIPHSGTPAQLIERYGISEKHIIKAVKEILHL